MTSSAVIKLSDKIITLYTKNSTLFLHDSIKNSDEIVDENVLSEFSIDFFSDFLSLIYIKEDNYFLYTYKNGVCSKKMLFDRDSFPCTKFDFFIYKNILTFIYCNENTINIMKYKDSVWTPPITVCEYKYLYKEIYKLIKISENHIALIYKTNINQTEYIELRLDQDIISEPVIITKNINFTGFSGFADSEKIYLAYSVKSGNFCTLFCCFKKEKGFCKPVLITKGLNLSDVFIVKYKNNIEVLYHMDKSFYYSTSNNNGNSFSGRIKIYDLSKEEIISSLFFKNINSQTNDFFASFVPSSKREPYNIFLQNYIKEYVSKGTTKDKNTPETKNIPEFSHDKTEPYLQKIKSLQSENEMLRRELQKYIQIKNDHY